MTTLYKYSSQNGEFLGTQEAQKRPNGQAILDVLYATIIVPPETPDGYAAVWSVPNGAWNLEEDHRQKYDATGVKVGGTQYWLPEDTYESEARYMTVLGPLPDGALLEAPTEPEPTLEEAKATKISELDAEATAKITAGFWYQDESVMDVPLHFSFDTEDQINFSDTMTGASLALTGDTSLAELLPSTVTWNGYEDIEHTNLVVVTFTATQFLLFWSYAQTSHKNTILEQVRLLKAEVVAAETLEEIYAIAWPSEENNTSTEGE